MSFFTRIAVALTGARHGMTDEQRILVWQFLEKHDVYQCRHGDCLGADKEFHDLSLGLEIPIIIHPPISTSNRAWCSGSNVTVLDERPYLVRNHAMVDAVDVLLVTPYEAREQRRSGSWATWRYAIKKKRRTFLFTPCGRVLEWTHGLKETTEGRAKSNPRSGLYRRKRRGKI